MEVEQRSGDFVYHFPSGSAAERDLNSISARLQTIHDAAQSVLSLRQAPDAPLHVFLTNDSGDTMPPGIGVRGNPDRPPEVRAVYRADTADDGLEVQLVDQILRCEAKVDLITQPRLLNGLTALLRSSADATSSMLGAREVERREHEEGTRASAAELIAQTRMRTSPLEELAITSFLAHLIDKQGARRFLDFAESISAKGVEAAAQMAFGRSLTDIETRWRAAAKKAAMGTAGQLIAFVKRLVAWLRPHKREAILVAFLVVFDAGFSAVSALSFSWLIDLAIKPRDAQMLWLILGGLGVGMVIVSGASVAQEYFNAKLGAYVARDIRRQLFEHLQRLSMSFHQRVSQGDVLARFSADINVLEMVTQAAVPAAVQASLRFVICLALLFTLEWRLALISVALLPLCLVGTKLFAAKAATASYERRRQEGEAVTVVQETLGATSVVKAFGLEERVVDKFRDASGRLADRILRASFLGSVMMRTSNMAIRIVELVVVGLAAYFAFGDLITVGTLVSFHALFMNVSMSLMGLTQILNPLIDGTGCIRRIDEILDEDPGVSDAEGAIDAPRVAKSVTFEGVSFGYTGDKHDLVDVGFSVAAGESVAFVGPSGSGKSTLINLLMRFYDPAKGVIRLDGVDIREITRASLRAQIGIVMQDNVLFNTTVRENIRLGRIDASDADVEAAARAAEVHDIILKMDEGYDTIVGERGGRLSGGQRQRVAIARALIRDPAILVLDEATSALDAATEAAINRTLYRLSADRMVFSVTHRLNSVVDMDRVVVLKAGRMVEQGGHLELVASGGLYSELWNSQQGFVEGESGQITVTSERLATVPVFKYFDLSMLGRLSERFNTEHFAANTEVFHQGDQADKLYLMVRGEVAVLSDRRGEERQLAVLRDGEMFGEIALLREVDRTATIRTRTACTFMTLQRESFGQLLEMSPKLKKKMIEMADERMPVASDDRN